MLRTILLATLLMMTIPAAMANPAQKLSIKGLLNYKQKVTVNAESKAVIELRDANKKLVKDLWIALRGRQVPVPFKLLVPRRDLPAGQHYLLRGGIVENNRAAWLSDYIEIDTSSDKVNAGILWLQPAPASK